MDQEELLQALTYGFLVGATAATGHSPSQFVAFGLATAWHTHIMAGVEGGEAQRVLTIVEYMQDAMEYDPFVNRALTEWEAGILDRILSRAL